MKSRAGFEKKGTFRFLTSSLAPLLAVLFLLNCPPLKPSGAKAEASAETIQLQSTENTETKEKIIPGPRFALYPAEARPGEPVTVGYSDNFGSAAAPRLQAVLIDSRGRSLAKANFFSMSRQDPVTMLSAESPADREQELRAAILAIPSTAPAGIAVIRIESANGIVRDLHFKINSREFASETIPLDQANTDLRTVPDPQKTAESDQLWTILNRTGTEIYYGGQFMPPVTSTRRTSLYGDRRVYSYVNGVNDTAIHAGVDYGVPTGTEVRACAAGKVVLAKFRIVTGNSVILEHLPGVYSLYYHMDKISVSEGTIIEAGSLLGHSGSTGLATGPHLHWEIRVSGENTDPDAFMARPILDKKDILNKLTN